MMTKLISNSRQNDNPRMYIRGSKWHTARHTGFSFAEVMFAVVILGIGFIMVAAVFPVAIQQTQVTGEENIAAALARQAANSVTQIQTALPNPSAYTNSGAAIPVSPLTPVPAQTVATQYLFPPTVKNYIVGSNVGIPNVTLSNYYQGGATPQASQTNVAPPAIVVPFTGFQWDVVKANAILPSDPRFAYVLFYKRENNSSAAELIVVAVEARNRSTYTSADITNNSSQVTISTTANDVKALSTSVSASSPTLTVICPDILTGTGLSNYQEGSYVEVPVPTGFTGAEIVSPMGRSYSLGRPIASPSGYYELNPGGSMALTAGSTGLWGTTVATGNPVVAPTTPITDAVAASVNAYAYAPATLQPTVAYASLQATADAPSGRICITSQCPATNATLSPPPNAVQGAFVIIADDYPFSPSGQATTPGVTQPQDYNIPPNLTELASITNTPVYPVYSVGSLNGRIFRLGAPVTQDASGNTLPPGTFNLDPAYGMRPASTSQYAPTYSPDTIPNPDVTVLANNRNFNPIAQGGMGCAKVYIIGAGATSPGSASPYSGPAQDIGIYASYFQVQ
jgi:hypothetical protein